MTTEGTADSAGTDGPADTLPPCAEWLGTEYDDARFDPPEIPNLSLDNTTAGLMLYASTLRSGPGGLELYAGICNDSDAKLCSVALQVEFYDHADALIGTASGAVQSGRLFSFPESPYPVYCVAPGQTAMAALTDLPPGLTLADLKSMGHRFPAFLIDHAMPVAAVSVGKVDVFETAAGVAFRGMVTNDSDAPMQDPQVSVFPITEAGRPLGNATSTASLEIPAGGTWTFETSVVPNAGAGQVAFASAAFVAMPQ